ncbi:MAG: hypothetical protein ACK56F_14160, partial [bacterium]
MISSYSKSTVPVVFTVGSVPPGTLSFSSTASRTDFPWRTSGVSSSRPEVLSFSIFSRAPLFRVFALFLRS